MPCQTCRHKESRGHAPPQSVIFMTIFWGLKKFFRSHEALAVKLPMGVPKVDVSIV